MPQSPGGPVEKEDAKNPPCMRVEVETIAEKRNVLIVSVLLPISGDLTLRSNTQRRVYVLRVREGPVLLHVCVYYCSTYPECFRASPAKQNTSSTHILRRFTVKPMLFAIPRTNKFGLEN